MEKSAKYYIVRHTKSGQVVARISDGDGCKRGGRVDPEVASMAELIIKRHQVTWRELAKI